MNAFQRTRGTEPPLQSWHEREKGHQTHEDRKLGKYQFGIQER